MKSEKLQALCESGQQQLMRMEYLQAEQALVQAEALAIAHKDFDTLARLYMPLQECRRQRRLRCGEGIVCLDLVSNGPEDHVDGRHVVENYAHGQLLVGGWGTIEPALKVRELQAEHELYLETFLGAVFPTDTGRAIVIVPLADTKLPDPAPRSLEALRKLLPPECIVLTESELPAGSQKGSAETFAKVMALWEQLHAPFLAAAERASDLLKQIEAYRKTIRVDYACELAHQKLSDTAHQLVRDKR